MMTIQVVAEREQKIQNEVKEITKVFYCSLCNKQYKLAIEFKGHLSSYDQNHRKRFKEMRKMHGSSSRDDRQKREHIRQGKEMTLSQFVAPNDFGKTSSGRAALGMKQGRDGVLRLVTRFREVDLEWRVCWRRADKAADLLGKGEHSGDLQGKRVQGGGMGI
ncbi:uncharacterized protein A4U43_C02F14850 [Asparagus officinalis]|uniref:Uncharacterized protein n=1 Tax=Asparagus officinalis TaxID=4686 RepID=A0A5P1FME5_ASPOF|nr:uncharacterized protein A4U43_C02F14850 [Asparagus officinalis]